MYCFKNIFKPGFFILKALKGILQHFKFVNWWICSFVGFFFMSRTGYTYKCVKNQESSLNNLRKSSGLTLSLTSEAIPWATQFFMRAYKIFLDYKRPGMLCLALPAAGSQLVAKCKKWTFKVSFLRQKLTEFFRKIYLRISI